MDPVSFSRRPQTDHRLWRECRVAFVRHHEFARDQASCCLPRDTHPRTKIDTVESRATEAPSGDVLAQGSRPDVLGFQRMTSAFEGTWVAQA